jgi:hypothetical protein
VKTRQVSPDCKNTRKRISDDMGSWTASAANMPIKPPEPGNCRDCGAPILWATTGKPSRIPLDPERRKGGKYEIIDNIATIVDAKGEPAYISHHITCKKSRLIPKKGI